jgi:hypothetical protein
MWFGPKAGLSMAKLSGEDVDSLFDDAKFKTGFAGGAFLSIGVAQQFTIQPELLYVMRGTKEDTTDAKLKLDYVALPILIKWMAPTQGKVKPNLFAGPEVAFLMSAKFDTVGGDFDVKDSTKSVDFGLVFGGGLDFDAGSGRVTFDVRYNLGLAKIDDTPTDYTIKNSGFAAFIGYAIPIGRKAVTP